jgi:putative DNA-invertase from lambdoid prophage Rac
MSGLFAYTRVTPASRSTAAVDLRKAAALAGHVVMADNMVIEVVTASVALSTRRGWRTLLDRMYEGDTLVVPTLGDLGDDAKGICVMVKHLARLGLRVHCLGLGSGQLDLAGPAGRSMMEVLAAVAVLAQAQRIQHEHLTTNVNEISPPLTRRKGRPPSLGLIQVTEARRLLASGISVAQVARFLGTSRQTIMRARAGNEG